MNFNVKTSDGDLFQVNSDLLRYSGTLKDMIDVCGIQDTVIPLPRVNSKILRKVLDWVIHQEEMRRGENASMKIVETAPLPKDLTVDVSPEMLFHLIITASFLGYDALLQNIFKNLIDWMEQNPLETINDTDFPKRLESAMECLMPTQSREELRGTLKPFKEKMERFVKPVFEQLLWLFGEKDIIKRFEVFTEKDWNDVYDDVKKLIMFFKNELIANMDQDNLEATLGAKSNWSTDELLKNLLTEALKEIDDDLRKWEANVGFNDWTKFLHRFNLSQASWTIVEAIQHTFSFCNDLAQNSIVFTMTNSRIFGGILAVAKKILLSDILNVIFQPLASYLKGPHLLKGLDILLGRASFFTCENISATQIIKLGTSNGAIFDTNVTFGDCQEIMKIFFKVAGLNENGVVPLPYLNKMVFEKILAWANYYKQTDKTSIYEHGLTKWDNQYFHVDMRTLFELIWAADYLNIPALLEATCQAVGVSMTESTPKQLINIATLIPDVVSEIHKMLERNFYLYT